MKNENFKENDIPYEEFAKFGFTRENILKLSKSDLDALLSGRRTSLLEVKRIQGIDRDLDLKVKFSLQRDRDGNIKLMVHPVRESINNDIKLTVHELNKLKEDQIVIKKIEGEKFMIQRDKDNNELLKVKAKDIMIPTHIGHIELSSTQREHLKKGNPILLESNNYKIAVSIDLNAKSGLKAQNLNDMTLAEKIAFDRAHPGVIGYLMTDENRNEYKQYQDRSNGNTMKLN